jgi:hypothetical protein
MVEELDPPNFGAGRCRFVTSRSHSYFRCNCSRASGPLEGVPIRDLRREFRDGSLRSAACAADGFRERLLQSGKAGLHTVSECL